MCLGFACDKCQGERFEKYYFEEYRDAEFPDGVKGLEKEEKQKQKKEGAEKRETVKSKGKGESERK